MTKPITIDFVSDISCPWCVIGLKGLEQALERIDDVEAEVRFQPFELNPHMPPEGQRLVDYAAQKYGSTPQQLNERRAMVRERAAELGFTIALPPEEGRVYNTFDAHRLLHWAGLNGRAFTSDRLARNTKNSMSSESLSATGSGSWRGATSRPRLVGRSSTTS